MKPIRRFAAAGLMMLSLLGTFAPSALSQEDRHVCVINRSSITIRYLYVSNVDNNYWGYDLLGTFNVVLPDHYVDTNIDDGTGHCLYDIKAVMYNGNEAVTRKFNVCSNSSWTVTD